MNTQLSVIFEDNHLIAVNKPSGLLAQGDETGDAPISDYIKEYIKLRYDKPGDVFLGTIHRIDRPVSGVLIFARTSKALERMNALFLERTIKKRYLAIVEKRPKELSGTLLHYIAKDPEKNIVAISERQRNKHYKLAKLEYKLLGSIANHHLLEVIPHSGRPHQIRAQLAKIGCHIRGDVKYGAAKANFDGSIHLHAHGLEFEHPVKKEMVSIMAIQPDEQLWNSFRNLIAEYYPLV